MMGRIKIAAIVLVCMIAAFLLLAGPFKWDVQQQATINASLYDISRQFTDLKNWPAWYPSMKGANCSISTPSNTVNATLSWKKDRLIITAMNPAAIVVKLTGDAGETYQSITGMPADNDRKTIITWTKQSTGWQWLKEKLFVSGGLSAGLNNLKSICENPATEYGFVINMEPVTDTVIVTQKLIVHNDEKLKQQHLLNDRLQSFLQSRQITADRNYIFTSIIPVGIPDSVAVAVGIPVAHKGIDKAEIKFLALPAKGRLLIGHYRGAYHGLEKLYKAMDKYVKDKGMRIVAQPMEEHSNFNALLNDTTTVSIKLIYPVY